MQIRRGCEADTERLVALAGQIFETEQEIPRALTQSGQETKAVVWLRRMSQDRVLGSPQANPAMMVWRSPSTIRGAPSPARAPR